MTREEAIKELLCIRRHYQYIIPCEETIAIDMAIEALKQVTGKLNNPDDSLLTADAEDCKEQKSKLDLISRAEAIEALRYAQHRFTVADEAGGMGSVKWSEDVIYFAAAERVLTELPSADRPTGEWIEVVRCKDCKWWEGCNNVKDYVDGFCSDGERKEE